MLLSVWLASGVPRAPLQAHERSRDASRKPRPIRGAGARHKLARRAARSSAADLMSTLICSCTYSCPCARTGEQPLFENRHGAFERPCKRREPHDAKNGVASAPAAVERAAKAREIARDACRCAPAACRPARQRGLSHGHLTVCTCTAPASIYTALKW